MHRTIIKLLCKEQTQFLVIFSLKKRLFGWFISHQISFFLLFIILERLTHWLIHSSVNQPEPEPDKQQACMKIGFRHSRNTIDENQFYNNQNIKFNLIKFILRFNKDPLVPDWSIICLSLRLVIYPILLNLSLRCSVAPLFIRSSACLL